MAERLTRMRFEHVRVWVALAVSTPLAIAITVALTLAYERRVSYLTSSFLAWDLFGLAYAWLTLRVFRGAAHDRLQALVQNRQVSAWAKVVAGGTDGPGFSVQFAAIALAAAALLPRLGSFTPQDEEGLLLTLLIVLAVIMSLVVVTLSYTVHYARCDISENGLSFPGETSPGFLDYLYFAASVATTFGTTDVDVTTTRLRRAVTGHAVLTLVFNTVIIALLVSALA